MDQTVLATYAEKYKQSVINEQLIRDSSFLTDFEFIGNVKVKSLTPKLLNVLSVAKSPFVIGGQLDEAITLSFLALISYEKVTNIDKFYKEVVVTNSMDKVLEDIGTYLDSSFQDTISGGESTEKHAPYYSGYAALVDMLAKEYGWTEEMIMNIPYKRLFQYLRVITKRNDPKAIFHNQSDKVKTEMLQKLNNL